MKQAPLHKLRRSWVPLVITAPTPPSIKLSDAEPSVSTLKSALDINCPFLCDYFNCVHIFIPSRYSTQSRENIHFFMALFPWFNSKKSKGARWCSLRSLQKFSVSELAFIRLRLDLQTLSNDTCLRSSSGKRIVFFLEFAMFWQITYPMPLTVDSALSASHGELIDWPVISLSPLFCTRSNVSTRLLLIQGCHPPAA